MGLNKLQWVKVSTLLGMVVLLYSGAIAVVTEIDKWLMPAPTESWETKAHEVEVAIIFGFGYELDEAGCMKAGEANDFLLRWTVENTAAKIIFVQEGVWAAACKTSDTTCTFSGRSLRRIHLHAENLYVNTLDTCFCALQKMEEEGRSRAVLVAHPLQLQRAFRDIEKIKNSRREWKEYQFVVPSIPDTPYPYHSYHWHTRNRFFYTAAELMARILDFLREVPSQCKAPLPEQADPSVIRTHPMVHITNDPSRS